MFECPMCINNTLLPSIPSDIYNHLKKEHNQWFNQKYNSPKKFFPIMFCRECEEFTTFQHKHCFYCKKSKSGFLAFKTKYELDQHLLSNHPRKKCC